MNFKKLIKNVSYSVYRLLPKPLRDKIYWIHCTYRYPAKFLHANGVFLSKMYVYSMKVLQRSIYLERQSIMNELVSSYDHLEISEEKGFVVCKPEYLPIEEALSEARSKFAAADLELLEKNSKKPFLVSIDLKLHLDSAIMRLAMSPELVTTIAKYVGMLPVLAGINLWYSPNKIYESNRSQMYHMDEEDLRQIKVFFMVEEISEDSGPLTLVTANSSRKIYYMLKQQGLTKRRNQKHTDETIQRFTKNEDIYPICGKPGTLALVDTSNCYHYGSRPGKKPRFVAMLQYYTPFSKELPYNWKMAKELKLSHLADKTTTRLERMILGSE